MNALVIPEDFRKDQFILQPIVAALLAAAGRPHAKVRVLTDPLLGGISRVLDRETMREIVDRYRGMTDLFVVCVDRDANPTRRAALDALERDMQALLPAGRLYVAEHAWQELEVWVLAGQGDLPNDWSWNDIRADPHPKERFFEPYARRRGVHDHRLGGGRKVLAEEAARRYDRIRRLCPEDVRALEDRIRAFLGA